MLAIDDSIGDRNLLRLALRSKPVDVLGVDSGIEGIEAAIHHLPDVIVVDWHMPGLDGQAVIETLRARPDTQDIPIIVLTGDEAVSAAALAAGANRCVVKTGSPFELAEAVQAACGL